MILQLNAFLQALADIIGIILSFLQPIITPIGQFMVDWITVVIGFFQQNLSGNLTLFIIICIILIVSGVIINIIWPGDKPGTIFSKGIDKIGDFDDKILGFDDDIVDSVRRCKDCGNPIGDADVCSLCGARN
ncbi:MAG: hypothetical protein ACFE9Z_11870 [Promethearchaeota archaeon]